METKYIFIYGTLKKDNYNHNLLNGNAKYISKALSHEKYAMYPNKDNTFPFLIKSRKESYIHGELYELIFNEVIYLLDEVEGVPDLYFRDIIKVLIFEKDKEKIVDAYVYFKNEDSYEKNIDYSKKIDSW